MIGKEFDNIDQSVGRSDAMLPRKIIKQKNKHPCIRKKVSTCVVDPLVATAVSRYTALSFAFQFSSLFDPYSARPVLIHAPTISVASASYPLPTNACKTSAAACRRVARSVPDADTERSRRINSRGSSSNCSISCSRSATFGIITP